jgi:anthranilate synthase component I
MMRPNKYIFASKILPLGGRNIAEIQAELLQKGDEYFAVVERPAKKTTYLYFSPIEVLTIKEGALTRERRQKTEKKVETVDSTNPLLSLKTYLSEITQISKGKLPDFSTGFFGYVGYDCVQYLEKIELPKERTVEPEACLMFYGNAVLIEPEQGRLTIVVTRDAKGEAATEALETIEKKLKSIKRSRAAAALKTIKSRSPSAPQKVPIEFQKGAEKVKNHIREGDIFQCVISARYQFTRRDPLKVYRALCQLNPSPYHYFFKLGKLSIVGASPEPLVVVTGDEVLSYPIAGTRPRGKTTTEDDRFEKQLRKSPKELAEHIMLVDLARNDLGRVCAPGTVHVRELMKTVRYSHVMHLVSIVAGKLKLGKTSLDALFAAFPAGTLTGAPKVRAM